MPLHAHVVSTMVMALRPRSGYTVDASGEISIQSSPTQLLDEGAIKELPVEKGVVINVLLMKIVSARIHTFIRERVHGSSDLTKDEYSVTLHKPLALKAPCGTVMNLKPWVAEGLSLDSMLCMLSLRQLPWEQLRTVFILPAKGHDLTFNFANESFESTVCLDILKKLVYGSGRLPIPDDLEENDARILDSWAASNYIEVVGRELGLTEEGKGAIVIGQTVGEPVAALQRAVGRNMSEMTRYELLLELKHHGWLLSDGTSKHIRDKAKTYQKGDDDNRFYFQVKGDKYQLFGVYMQALLTCADSASKLTEVQHLKTEDFYLELLGRQTKNRRPAKVKV